MPRKLEEAESGPRQTEARPGSQPHTDLWRDRSKAQGYRDPVQNKQFTKPACEHSSVFSPVSAIGWHCLHLGDTVKGHDGSVGRSLQADLAALWLWERGAPVWSVLLALVTEIILWGEEVAVESPGRVDQSEPCSEAQERDQGWAGTGLPVFPPVWGAFQGLSGAGCSPGSSEALRRELPCLGAPAV